MTRDPVFLLVVDRPKPSLEADLLLSTKYPLQALKAISVLEALVPQQLSFRVYRHDEVLGDPTLVLSITAGQWRVVGASKVAAVEGRA